MSHASIDHQGRGRESKRFHSDQSGELTNLRDVSRSDSSELLKK